MEVIFVVGSLMIEGFNLCNTYKFSVSRETVDIINLVIIIRMFSNFVDSILNSCIFIDEEIITAHYTAGSVLVVF